MGCRGLTPFRLSSRMAAVRCGFTVDEQADLAQANDDVEARCLGIF